MPFPLTLFCTFFLVVIRAFYIELILLRLLLFAHLWVFGFHEVASGWKGVKFGKSKFARLWRKTPIEIWSRRTFGPENIENIFFQSWYLLTLINVYKIIFSVLKVILGSQSGIGVYRCTADYIPKYWSDWDAVKQSKHAIILWLRRSTFEDD